MRHPSSALATLAALGALALPHRGEAQLIPIRTVPLATGDQFMVHPSETSAMGGLSIALDDPLLDPFVNPAKGARLADTRLFGTPSFYSVSDDGGSARSLPAGAIFQGDAWFGGGSLTIQELEAAERPFFFWGGGAPRLLSEESSTNTYVHGLLGRRMGREDRTSVGVGISWASLGAMHGVELLYPLADRIEQDGSRLDLRLGVLHEWEEERRLEAVLVHERLDMTHDVTIREFVWDEEQLTGQWVTSQEENLDRTDVWGLHLGYRQPVGRNGWDMGLEMTANRKDHPKIPNYEIMNIPRDPGHSWAWNFGAGLARTSGPASYGIDLVYEPIWTDTWAEAAEPVETAGGDVIPVGGRTVENEFFFSNVRARMGLSYEERQYALRLGLRVHSIDYTLEQWDNVAATRRTQDEAWMEWTPTWGLSLLFSEVRIHYSGQRTSGTGRPGTAWNGPGFGATLEALATAGDFLPAPSGPLTLQEATVTTHRISVELPIR